MAKTILIVEDDPNISELVQMYLEKEGYHTKIAADGGLRGCAAGGQRDDEDQYGNEHQAHPADAVPERARRQARQELIEPVAKALERLPGKRAQLFEQRDKNPANLFEQHPCPTPKAFHASTSPFLTVSISVRMEPVYQTTVSIP